MVSFTTLFLTGLTGASALEISSRRAFVGTAAGAAILGGFSQDANAVISSKPCSAGVGEGCEDLAEGNEFIKRLQEKSALNREANLRESTMAYQMKNYPDFFSAVGKVMVKRQSDGGFSLLTEAELEPLRKAGKIRTESAKAFGGKVNDYTQKPTVVWLDE